MTSRKQLDVMVPVSFDAFFMDTVDVVADKLIDLYQKYGYTNFALSGPCNGWINFGFPPLEYFVEKAKMFAEIKEKVAPYGIECGWWASFSLKTGASDQIGHYIDINGNLEDYTACPLCDNFRSKITEIFSEFARIAKPKYIVIEDDYCIYDGCFCDNHLNAFEKQMGRYYTREELVECRNSDDPEKLEIFKQWREFSKSTMLELSRLIRAAVDVESPEVHISPFQSGGTDYEGFSTEEHARILAGEGHTPSSRIYGTYYAFEFEEARLPEVMFHALYSKQHFGDDFKFIHESDAYPFSSYLISGNEMKSLMSAVYSYGFEGSILLLTPFATDHRDEDIYNIMFAKERERFTTAYNISKDCELKGVELCFDPFYNTISKTGVYWDPLWTRALGWFGIPYTSKKADVAFWDSVQAKYADDATIMEYLSKGLFLDGDAAKILCERGYGEYLGVKMGNVVTLGVGEFDQCSLEVVRKDFVYDCSGYYMPNTRMWNLMGNGVLYAVEPIAPECEIITEFETFKHDVLAAAMTRYENSLGGRVVVMGTTLKGNRSQCLYNRQRQELIQNLIKWCSDDYAFVKRATKVFCIMNEPKSDDLDFKGMLTLINLSSDEYENLNIYLPEKWRVYTELKSLNIDGEWEELSYSRTDDGICLHDELRNGHPIYILFK